MGGNQKSIRTWWLHSRIVYAKMSVDLGLWTLAIPIALYLRLGSLDVSSEVAGVLFAYALLTTPLKGMLILLSRLEVRSWRRATVQDLAVLVGIVAAGTLIEFSAGLLLFSSSGAPRTLPLIEGVVALLAMAGLRMTVRLARERSLIRGSDRPTQRVLLVGAGEAGAMMAREMRRRIGDGLVPIGFLDDDPMKRSMRISGVPVLGMIHNMAAVAAEREIDEIIITMPSVTGKETRKIVVMAREAGLECRTMPSLGQILTGDIDLTRLRRVEVEDLLRREPIDLAQGGAANYLRERVVLVTGAGGSIGSELVRQIARLSPDRVILVGRGEDSIFRIQQEVARDYPMVRSEAVLADVRDRSKLDRVFAEHRPQVVLHAAAFKHVPLLQHNIDEAVLNNIGGTLNVARVAVAHDIERFVNVSSDKAVSPSSVLGITKLLAEQGVRNIAADVGAGWSYASVRFGNVLGSRGSVVPLFQEQIRRGGPITVTDPEMTRFFMTIPEAAQLVLQAGGLDENGGVFVLDMGDPVRIVDLAEDLVRLSGHQPDEIEIVYTGARPGEKMHEELFTDEEHVTATRFPKIMLTHVPPPTSQELSRIDLLLDAAARHDRGELTRLLRTFESQKPLRAADGTFDRTT